MQTIRRTSTRQMRLRAILRAFGLLLSPLAFGCAMQTTRPATEEAEVHAEALSDACNNCVGGECADLHCFQSSVEGDFFVQTADPDPDGPAPGLPPSNTPPVTNPSTQCLQRCLPSYNQCTDNCDLWFGDFTVPEWTICVDNCYAEYNSCLARCDGITALSSVSSDPSYITANAAYWTP